MSESSEFLWYIPNQVAPGHRGDVAGEGHNSLETLTSHARALEDHGWKGALIGSGWGRPDTFTVAGAPQEAVRVGLGGSKTREECRHMLEIIDDVESRHAGIKARLVKEEKLHRFINVYVNDEDVRFSGGLETAISDGDSVTILPAVAGG